MYNWCASLVFIHIVDNCVLPAAVSCGPAPKAHANGQRTRSGTTFGSTVTYTCNRGYNVPRDNRRTCMANGQWSGSTPTCNRKLYTVLFLLLHGHQKSIRAMIHTTVWWQLEVHLVCVGTDFAKYNIFGVLAWLLIGKMSVSISAWMMCMLAL